VPIASPADFNHGTSWNYETSLAWLEMVHRISPFRSEHAAAKIPSIGLPRLVADYAQLLYALNLLQRVMEDWGIGASTVHTHASRTRQRGTAPLRFTSRGRHAARAASATARARLAPMTLLAAIAVLLVVFQHRFRDFEAVVAAHLCSVVTPTLAAPGAPIVWFGLGTPNGFGLEITPDCSSALLIAPLCVLGIGLMVPRRLSLRRVWAGLTVAAALLVTGNMARIGLIAEMIHLYGLGTGYQFGHLILGSLLSIVCIATSMVVLTSIVTGRGRRWALRPLPHGRRGATA
jgi:exosortase/archaeosortase family protein